MHLILFLLFLLAHSWGEATTGQYCGQQAPLHTDYVVSTYEETRLVQGCISTEGHPANRVVVIRANTTSTDILLTLTGTAIRAKPGIDTHPRFPLFLFQT